MPIERIYTTLWYTNTKVTVGDSLGVKLARLSKRVDRAYDFCRWIDPDPSTSVYLFAAPEYYFQQGPTKRYYTEEVKNKLVHRLAELANGHPRMVIVAGTLPWKRMKPHLARPGKKWKGPVRVNPHGHVPGPGKGEKQYEGFNTAYVFYGKKGMHEYYHYHKATDVMESLRDDSDTEYRTGASIGLFPIEDLLFGIEICGDNAHQTLMRTVGAMRVDVQLLISQGMDHNFGTGSLNRYPVKDGGYFVHCDGTEEYDAANGVWQITPGRGTHGTQHPVSVTTPTLFEDDTMEGIRARGYQIVKGVLKREGGNTTFQYFDKTGHVETPFLLTGNTIKIPPIDAQGGPMLAEDLKVFEMQMDTG